MSHVTSRVLLERLIVNRPHPWGLLITFIDLIKNPTYKFWSHEFVHCAPEIEKYDLPLQLFWQSAFLLFCRLFESVARSCMQKQTGSQAAMTRETHQQHETTATWYHDSELKDFNYCFIVFDCNYRSKRFN